MDSILKRALINALGVVVYVICVAVFIFSLQRFSSQPDNPILIPISMMLLLVCSATITGFLVFGKPIMLYIDGRKKEAMALLMHTIGILFVMTLIFFAALWMYYL
jgi:hypothetical protein